MPIVSELYIYPVKSLGGISVETAALTDRGFQYDRRWMLVDDNNTFLTQREHPQMALLQTALSENGIQVFHKHNKDENIIFPFTPATNTRMIVIVWQDFCLASPVSPMADEWFSAMLGIQCKLVFMPDESLRKVDIRYAVNDKNVTSFSDAYPVLMIGQESLNDLNRRMPLALSMNRFRPNIVFTGAEPYEEDVMEQFIINGISFYGVKPCARCTIPTVDQDTSFKNKEPLKTLASYRMMNNNIYFGQNVIYDGTGTIRVGGEIKITKRRSKLIFGNEAF